jgi:tRNA-dependent cyclodipeptide synthase
MSKTHLISSIFEKQLKNDQIAHIIGMSPGNSYFKNEEIQYLLDTCINRFDNVVILIADIPAINTYIALGYSANRARTDKAVRKGNNLKNKVKTVMLKSGYTNDQVCIINWAEDIENTPDYQKCYQKILDLYNTNPSFSVAANETTKIVLEGSSKYIPDIKKATKTAVHYLLSELAFLEYAPQFLNIYKAIYVYHKNWLIYEDYIAGKFDKNPKPHLDFLLIENPYETYNPIWGLEETEKDENIFNDALERIEKTNILRVGFTNYTPAFMYDQDYQNFTGIYYEIIVTIAKKYDLKINWAEEVGYGVVTDGLNTQRFDLFGSPAWPTPERLAEADYSIWLYKSPAYVYVRPSYQKNINEIRQDKLARVVVKENDISDSIAKADFPSTRQVKIPQLTRTEQLLTFVANNRADFTFVEPHLANTFNKTHGTNLVIASESPIRWYDNSFIVGKREKRLKAFLDHELTQLLQDGTIETLINKYAGNQHTFIINK